MRDVRSDGRGVLLEPLADGITPKAQREQSKGQAHVAMPFSLRQYIDYLHEAMACEREVSQSKTPSDNAKRWMRAKALMKKKQRAYGRAGPLEQWHAQHRKRPIDKALPASAPY